MSNLHAPTIPSGPTTAPVANGSAAQLSIAELQKKKDNVEGELKALGGVLDSVRGSSLLPPSPPPLPSATLLPPRQQSRLANTSGVARSTAST